MKKVILASMLALAFTLQTPVSAYAQKDFWGTIIGGVVGGAIGNQFGKGKGKTVATIAGAIIGAAIGNEIGRDLDEADRRAFMESRQSCLSRDLGRPCRWDGRRYGSRSGAWGEIVTVREGYHYDQDAYCREYRSVTYFRGKKTVRTSLACEYEDGVWTEETTRSTRVRWNRF